MLNNKPILGISMGDPSGNGPEISVKALMNPAIYDRCNPIIIGDASSLEAARFTVPGGETITIHAVKEVKDAVYTPGTIDVLDMGLVDLSKRLYKKDRQKLAETMTPEELEKAYTESRIMCGDCAF